MRQQPAPDRAHGRPAALVVVAASAGGLAALTALLGALPADFPVPVVVVQHLSPHHESLLAELLGHRCLLRVEQAVAGAKLAPATVYTAPPDQHVLVTPGGELDLSHSAREHFVRPSADVLFESAARAYPGQTIGVVLTGTGSDGNEGVRAIHATAGTVVVQDPATAEFKGMPQAAVDTGAADLILALDDIAPALVALVGSRSVS